MLQPNGCLRVISWAAGQEMLKFTLPTPDLNSPNHNQFARSPVYVKIARIQAGPKQTNATTPPHRSEPATGSLPRQHFPAEVKVVGVHFSDSLPARSVRCVRQLKPRRFPNPPSYARGRVIVEGSFSKGSRCWRRIVWRCWRCWWWASATGRYCRALGSGGSPWGRLWSSGTGWRKNWTRSARGTRSWCVTVSGFKFGVCQKKRA